jgi:ribosomal protein L28
MKVCEICGKGSQMGGTRKKLRGHYNPVNWSRKQANLQKTRLVSGKRILACTSCIKKAAKSTK